ncbi:MAG: hypothetical protein LBT09_10940 [Planctomycetaceae bacterium]|nr:hypothetical protein [Planctomycetaceae bacterium]
MIVIISLIVQLRKRHILESARKRKQYDAIVAAQKEKREELIQKGEDPKKKPGTSEMTRVPINDPFGNKFSSGAAQGQIAKLEAELFALGRQLIGQLDSKMIAIETLTLEANRTANRLELLIEHFEQVADKLENSRKNKIETPEKNQNKQIAPNHTSQINNTINNVTKIPPQNPITESEKLGNENIRRGVEPQPVNFTDYLSELETEINEFQDKVDEFGGGKEVTILRAVTEQENNLPDKSAKITSAEIKPASIASTQSNDPLALSAPRFPGENSTDKNIRTKIPASNKENYQPVGLSIDSLFNDPASHTTTATTTTSSNSANNTNMPNRKQIEMLSNYGYSTKEIAQNLNIPIGEVDLILSTKK